MPIVFDIYRIKQIIISALRKSELRELLSSYFASKGYSLVGMEVLNDPLQNLYRVSLRVLHQEPYDLQLVIYGDELKSGTISDVCYKLRVLDTCLQCGKAKLGRYFTSKQDGTVLCPECKEA